MRKGKIYCPANGWDCPYYKKGECGIENPLEECDDFGYFWDADEKEKQKSALLAGTAAVTAGLVTALIKKK